MNGYVNLSVHKAPVSDSHETSRFQADAESILSLPLVQRGWLAHPRRFKLRIMHPRILSLASY